MPSLEMLSSPEEEKQSGATSGRAALLIAATVLFNTIVGVYSAEKTSFLIKDVLGLSASQMSTLGIITGIPSYLRPFLGAGSDLFPLFGFHRRSYYIVSWILAAFGYFVLAGISHYHYSSVVILSIVIGLGANLLFVIIDSVMVSIGNLHGTVGVLQTIQQGLPLLLGFALAHYGGYVTQNWSYARCFTAAGIFSLLGILLTITIPDKRVSHARSVHESEEEHRLRLRGIHDERARIAAALRQAARTPGLWAVVAYVFYLIITPGTGTAQFYYTVNVLHFSKQFIGDLNMPSNAGALLGILFFALASRRLPVRAMVWGAFLMDCSLYLIAMGLHNHFTGILVTFIGAFFGFIYNLCLLTIAARACPPGVEATVYGLVMSAIYLAGALGDKIGASLFDYLGPGTHHSITHGWFGMLWAGFIFTVIAAVFIPFLPEWTKSSEPLRAKKAA